MFSTRIIIFQFLFTIQLVLGVIASTVHADNDTTTIVVPNQVAIDCIKYFYESTLDKKTTVSKLLECASASGFKYQMGQPITLAGQNLSSYANFSVIVPLVVQFPLLQEDGSLQWTNVIYQIPAANFLTASTQEKMANLADKGVSDYYGHPNGIISCWWVGSEACTNAKLELKNELMSLMLLQLRSVLKEKIQTNFFIGTVFDVDFTLNTITKDATAKLSLPRNPDSSLAVKLPDPQVQDPIKINQGFDSNDQPIPRPPQNVLGDLIALAKDNNLANFTSALFSQYGFGLPLLQTAIALSNAHESIEENQGQAGALYNLAIAVFSDVSTIFPTKIPMSLYLAVGGTNLAVSIGQAVNSTLNGSEFTPAQQKGLILESAILLGSIKLAALQKPVNVPLTNRANQALEKIINELNVKILTEDQYLAAVARLHADLRQVAMNAFINQRQLAALIEIDSKLYQQALDAMSNAQIGTGAPNLKNFLKLGGPN